MTNEPKSMSRYVLTATLIVAPLLYFIAAHVDQRVAPVSGYVAQVYGVAQDSKLAQANVNHAAR